MEAANIRFRPKADMASPQILQRSLSV